MPMERDCWPAFTYYLLMRKNKLQLRQKNLDCGSLKLFFGLRNYFKVLISANILLLFIYMSHPLTNALTQYQFGFIPVTSTPCFKTFNMSLILRTLSESPFW